MRVSVVLCEHTLERYEDCQACAESVLTQSYENIELVLVADGNEAVCTQFRDEYRDNPRVTIECNDTNVGLLESRNRGAEAASGDIVAFIDDDAIADTDWIAALVSSYESEDALAVGGQMTPAWVAGKPAFLPAEFYWLVGVTHEGFGPELCARLDQRFNRQVFYNPQAKVAHKVFEYRTQLSWLIDRAFWQGYSKRGMETFTPDSSAEETAFLRVLLTQRLPHRVRYISSHPSVYELVQLMTVFGFTLVVGLGYLYGIYKWGLR